MNYFQARQVDPGANRKDAGKWRYTQMRDKEVWPVGYCRDCPGHDTRDEAYEHQRQYEIDNATFLRSDEDVDEELQRFKCEVCGTLTLSRAGIGPGMPTEIHLCEEHLDRDSLAAAWDGPGDVISS